jgi:hypothetical protein
MPSPWYFAWAGGAIQEQTTLVTNGTTHGGVLETKTIVGDTKPYQIVNLADTSGLEEGALYRIDGSNINPDTYLIYDSGVTSGAPGSLNLTQSPTAYVNSATFKLTKSIIVGEVAGSIVVGSNVVVLDDIDLPAGWYSISGTGIALTHLTITEIYTPPLGGATITNTTTQDVIINSAYFQYDGSSGSAHMRYRVANVTTHSTIDITTGQPTTATTYNVIEVAPTAIATGLFSMVISGMPDQDWYSVTGIPDGVLAGLTTGLRYNISGNGLQVSTTFVAPSGGNAIEIDQAASSSQLNAILTITGPRTPDAAFDPAIHDRFDADILDIVIAQEEGGFATLNVHMRLTNPTIGLLALGRNLWCWLSWDQAWTPDGTATPDLVPLFNGRLIGVPKLQAGEIVELEFLARPDDFAVQKNELVASLAVLPYYDPIWLATNINPDTVLETYSALFHIDRATLGVSVSDMLQGEDGTIEIGEDVAFYDNFTLAYSQAPLVSVTVSGTVNWQQQAEGFLDVTDTIVRAFAAQGSPWKTAFALADLRSYRGYGSKGGGLISCLCGEGLKSDWPKPGTSIGGGWSLTTLNDGDGVPLCYVIDANKPSGWFRQANYTITLAGQVPVVAEDPTNTDQTNAQVMFNSYSQFQMIFTFSVYKIKMTLQFKASRRRTETISAVMTADVQRLLSDSSDSDRETVVLSSEYVAQGVDPGGEVPIGNVAYRSYFQTDRGARSFEYLLLAARAKLRARSRAVGLTFATDWRTALNINLRNSVLLSDRRLPGGAAGGKVTSYRLSVVGGKMLGEFTIGCAIGNGGPATAVAGVNSYVEDNYVNSGYQVVAGGQISLLTDELAYQSLDNFAIVDDGLDLTHLTVASAVNECIVTNGPSTQIKALAPYNNTVMPTNGDPQTTMRTVTTTVTLDLKPVTGSEFHTSFFPAVSELALPKMIDLEATGDLDTAEWDCGMPADSIWDGGSTVWDQPNG